jgi:hypothetical protein
LSILDIARPCRPFVSLPAFPFHSASRLDRLLVSPELPCQPSAVFGTRGVLPREVLVEHLPTFLRQVLDGLVEQIKTRKRRYPAGQQSRSSFVHALGASVWTYASGLHRSRACSRRPAYAPTCSSRIVAPACIPRDRARRRPSWPSVRSPGSPVGVVPAPVPCGRSTAEW